MEESGAQEGGIHVHVIHFIVQQKRAHYKAMIPQWEKKETTLVCYMCFYSCPSWFPLLLCSPFPCPVFQLSILCSAPRCFFSFSLKLNQMMLLFHSQTLQCLPIKYKLLTVYKALGRLASLIFDSLLLIHWAPVILDYLVLVQAKLFLLSAYELALPSALSPISFHHLADTQKDCL